jgi:D-sedoheptulose 7-phosphate isomerase
VTVGETTDFLYPFIEGDERDERALLDDLARSADAKASASAALRAETLRREAPTIAAAGAAIAQRCMRGGRVLTFGNGGSATDAVGIAALFADPPEGPPVPARSLVGEPAVLTALGNDVGFDLVFARQVIAHGRAGDVALGVSTSGGSRNVLAAFAEARRRGLLTVGLAGYDGGEMARSPDVDHCLVVRADSVHRIQEAQAALGVALWSAVIEHIVPGDVAGREPPPDLGRARG